MGPFGERPHLAVGVSGGADSTALALLARDWTFRRSGAVVALVVDHGLRADSADEARLAIGRLATLNIPARLLTLAVGAGSGLQARARAARHAALAQAARAEGCPHLVLGHHARDQAETVAMRMARGGGGLAGIPAWTARDGVVILRPLLRVHPAALRAYLQERDVGWAEDPSNQDPRFERGRLRAAVDPQPSPLPGAVERRQAIEQEAARFLARHVMLAPEGYAVIDAADAPPAALSALIRTVAGRTYPPGQAPVRRLAARLRPATLGGAVLAPAGRLGPGWLLTREPAACSPPIAAVAGAVWDGRFGLTQTVEGTVGALGKDAAAAPSHLPALVRRSLPCLRHAGGLVFPAAADFAPPQPATGHPFIGHANISSHQSLLDVMPF